MEKEFLQQVDAGERFEFGANWRTFLNTLNDERISEAEKSLTEMLGKKPADGQTFLDIGSGSGLFSLAARKLGYSVYSFDFDKNSVECTRSLKNKYFHSDDQWVIEEASVLNKKYIAGIDQFDVVYSWGVLHHTGQMWTALDNACLPVKPGGKLFIAIYNDQGIQSRIWLFIKKTYNANLFGKLLIKILLIPYFAITFFLFDLLTLKNPFSRYSEYKKSRGMSIFTDWIDWMGGYPFEVATPKQIIDFYKERGFMTDKIITTKRHGCNQFVFIKNS